MRIDRSWRKRPAALKFDCLERRRLFAGEFATWVGQQGGLDYQSDGPVGIADDYADVQIQLSGLQVTNGHNLEIAQVYLSRAGGGGAYAYSNNATSNLTLVRPGNSNVANLFFEPYLTDPVHTLYDTFWIQYTNGQVVNLVPSGGFFTTTLTDANLRVPGKSLAVQVNGQNGPDLVGQSPNAGSDGQIDYHVTVTNLSGQDQVDYFSLTSAAGYTWATQPQGAGDYGTRPPGAWDADFVAAANGSSGDFYFQPPIGVNLGTLTLTVHYFENFPNGKTDSVSFAIPATSNKPVSAPAPPTVSNGSVQAHWAGQIGQGIAGIPAGSVHVALSGLPTSKTIQSIVVSNSTSFTWAYQAPGTTLQNVADGTFALTYLAQSDTTRADLYFAPNRNEAGSALSARINFSDGTMAFVTFAGGTSNPDAYSPAPALPSSPVKVAPAQAASLGSLLTDGQHPWVQLSAGTYSLNSPLILTRAVTLTTDPGATVVLQFNLGSVATTDPIEIRASHVHLSGFQVTFSGSVQYGADVNNPAAVIGVKNSGTVPLVDTLISGVTFYAPSPGGQDPDLFDAIWTDPRSSGIISNNVFIGQGIMFNGGPWLVMGNDYRGALAGTTIAEAFTTMKSGHDIQVLNNTVHQVAATGVTDRFYFQRQAINSVVAGNYVFGGVGQPVGLAPNLPEVIMNDDTDPVFTGVPTYVSADGRVLKVGLDRNFVTPVPGYVVSILSSSYTGSQRWFRIAQVLDSTTFLMADPLPTAGSYTISINYGYTQNAFTNNTIDATGRNSSVVGLFPGGAQFGTVVKDNHFIAGIPLQFRIEMTQPPLPGAQYPASDLWAYIPKYDITVTGNLFDDPASVLFYSWNDSAYYASVDQVVFVGGFTNNTFTYSAGYLASAPPVIASVKIGGDTRVNTSAYRITEFSGNNALMPTPASARPIVLYNNGIAGSPPSLVLPATPTAPGSLTATSDAVNIQVDLAWGAVSGAVGYSVERSPTGTVGWTQVAALAGNVTTYNDTTVNPSTTYYYRVRALAAAGYSTYRGPASATTRASAVPPPIAVSLNQDNHDYANLPWNAPNPPFGSDGYQDVHIQLINLPPSLVVDRITVWPYGGGEYRYNRNPALAQSAAFFRSSGSTTGDLYVQPMQGYTKNAFAVAIYYVGAASPVVVYTPVNADSQRPSVTAASLNQDNHDYANWPWNAPNPPFGPDGNQDIHIQLTNLPTQQVVDQITVWPYGGGEYLYNRNPAVRQSAAFFRSSGSTTGDLYVQPMQDYRNNAFAVDITYVGVANVVVVFVPVNADARLPMLSGASLGQDGRDSVGLSNPATPDGHKDLHIRVQGLPSYTAASFVDVSVVGGTGEWQFGGQNPRIWAASLVAGEGGPNLGGIYIQPDSSFLNRDGTLKPLTLAITIRYANGTLGKSFFMSNVTANPNL